MVLVVNDGGASGIEIVKQLLLRKHDVVLIEREPFNDENLLKEGSLKTYVVDFYKTENIAEEIKKILADGIKLKGFVYAAGIGGVRPLGLTTTPFLHQMMNANLYAFVEFVRCVCKKIYFESEGSVVAISSVSSTKGLKSKIAYSASKAALDGAIRGMAAELADRKIRVNSIQKGWVRADMQHGFIQDNMALSEQDDLKKQLLGVIETEDLAKLVCYLLSDDAKFITGTNMVLDGGYTIS